MKSENIIVIGLLGIGLWYLLRGQTASAAIGDPFAQRLTGIQAGIDRLDAKRDKRKREDAMRRAAGLPTHSRGW